MHYSTCSCAAGWGRRARCGGRTRSRSCEQHPLDSLVPLPSSRRPFVRCRLGPQGTLRADPEQVLDGTAVRTTVRNSDPEYIKRLKREMHVALRYMMTRFMMTHPAMISRTPDTLGWCWLGW